MHQYLFRLFTFVDGEEVSEHGVVQAGGVLEAAWLSKVGRQLAPPSVVRAVEAYVETLGWESGRYDVWLYYLTPRTDTGVLETKSGFEPCTITIRVP